ncbi:MAG: DivIVA domain-containing protein [Frankia sp.]|nr:DivIVA domain-containing protein [Frankia sp.]
MLLVIKVLAIAAVLFGVFAIIAGQGEGLDEIAPDGAEPELPPGRLHADDVEGVRFSLAFRGYRMAEVDTVIDRLARELAERDAELAQTTQTDGGEIRDPVGLSTFPSVAAAVLHDDEAHVVAAAGRHAAAARAEDATPEPEVEAYVPPPDDEWRPPLAQTFPEPERSAEPDIPAPTAPTAPDEPDEPDEPDVAPIVPPSPLPPITPSPEWSPPASTPEVAPTSPPEVPTVPDTDEGSGR